MGLGIENPNPRTHGFIIPGPIDKLAHASPQTNPVGPAQLIETSIKPESQPQTLTSTPRPFTLGHSLPLAAAHLGAAPLPCRSVAPRPDSEQRPPPSAPHHRAAPPVAAWPSPSHLQSSPPPSSPALAVAPECPLPSRRFAAWHCCCLPRFCLWLQCRWPVRRTSSLLPATFCLISCYSWWN
ncbi:hypothetical protein PVAP13_2NG020700 [Panicum virgatum]|uniref:Uncharacterized protein n=1 Tax=Panicum virgatum TaxID=38727 RepID=A0A8T0V8J8_PANVG|nr:hypothetical protein PVAP13_2NG020700 [Panicum virgatum]